mmetsp:Transcript_97309/g.270713  ORF Transcript_97309/g.270713 Transcript_97309/m.270713 type:complete len:410 (-) Transcript_97309:27-1256(-)|eukprot:CAMPEP_0179045744 /NCGR_PEP_ID=MMETSP0796-20121207/18333_1 /TAXON_ID=73915 /ORGANISM="Pyrodinium bahamense, Strain pbaha01" /LENGTH=409 /DNA_ID=CAMNT_0020742155 /DNA_START=77 /DNA_END=1303 /DNA_ORIENTATION=-
MELQTHSGPGTDLLCSRYRCETCWKTFQNTVEALQHQRDRGLLHHFVEALHPAPGDHVFTAQYKSGIEDEHEDGEGKEIGSVGTASCVDSAKQLAVDLISLPEHHGIFIGSGGTCQPGHTRGEVVHFRGCGRGVLLSSGCQVDRIELRDFCRDQRLFLQPHDTRLPADEIVHRAVWSLGKRGYHCQGFNCEHFATWCCTGTAASAQAWYSSAVVDPVFPFGWAAVVAKDTACHRWDLWGSGAEWCSCGRSVSSSERADYRCSAGHVSCRYCVKARSDASLVEAARVQGNETARASMGASQGDPGVEPALRLARPLSCLWSACWEPLEAGNEGADPPGAAPTPQALCLPAASGRCAPLHPARVRHRVTLPQHLPRRQRAKPLEGSKHLPVDVATASNEQVIRADKAAGTR